jgi:hypothetical protein
MTAAKPERDTLRRDAAARDPRHPESCCLQRNGPEVAHGKARTAALAKQPIKLREEGVKERPPCAMRIEAMIRVARSSEPGRGPPRKSPSLRVGGLMCWRAVAPGRGRQRQEDGARLGTVRGPSTALRTTPPAIRQHRAARNSEHTFDRTCLGCDR